MQCEIAMHQKAGTVLLKYGGAVVVTALMVILRWLLDPWLGHYLPFATVYGAVAFAVWSGGYRTALIAAIVGYCACDYFFIEPRGSLVISDVHDQIGLALFALSCSLIIGLGEGQHFARRQAERSRRRLAEITEQLRIVTDCMDAPVTRCSKDLRYVWVSKPYADWVRKPVEEIVGHPIIEIIGSDAFKRLEPYFKRVLTGEKVKYEEVASFAGIGPRWINAIYTPTFAPDGTVDGWVAVVIDVTDRHQHEQRLEDADRHKDDFLAVLAHELRNPLSPIRSALELQKIAGDDTEAIAESRGIMERQVAQLVHLVDDLMDVSRIKTGKLGLRTENVHLEEVVRHAVEASRPLIDENGHEFVISSIPENVIVEADSARLAQVFSNLLNNSAKYTDRSGRIWLTVELQGSDAVVTIKDNGVGISTDNLPFIFDMFAQAEKSPKRTQGGLGIGLTLAKQIVELHGGRIEVRSDGPGNGSEFSVRLPIVLPKRAVQMKDADCSNQGDQSIPRRRILIVDDMKEAAQTLASLLRTKGQEVTVVFDGTSAIDVVLVSKPDIVFVDLGMPELNGFEVAQRLRARPELQRLMLVALTGYGQEEARSKALKAGFDRFVLKPASMKELEQILLNDAPSEATPGGGSG